MTQREREREERQPRTIAATANFTPHGSITILTAPLTVSLGLFQPPEHTPTHTHPHPPTPTDTDTNHVFDVCLHGCRLNDHSSNLAIIFMFCSISAVSHFWIFYFLYNYMLNKISYSKQKTK